MSEPPRPSTGALIGGIIAGLVAGSTLLSLIVFVLAGTLLSSLRVSQSAPIFIVGYVIAVGLGVWGLTAGRRHSGFWTGLLIGSAIGMLGGTALCNMLIVQMNNGSMR